MPKKVCFFCEKKHKMSIKTHTKYTKNTQSVHKKHTKCAQKRTNGTFLKSRPKQAFFDELR